MSKIHTITQKKITNDLGQRIKKARQEAGLSQKDLGDALQLSDRAISTYEVGRAKPPIDTLRQISKATQKSLRYFLEGEFSDYDLEVKLSKIEDELAEVKKMLASRKN